MTPTLTPTLLQRVVAQYSKLAAPPGTPRAKVPGTPSGPGWEKIPGAKSAHGGMRRKQPNGKWRYWYPSARQATHASAHHMAMSNHHLEMTRKHPKGSKLHEDHSKLAVTHLDKARGSAMHAAKRLHAGGRKKLHNELDKHLKAAVKKAPLGAGRKIASHYLKMNHAHIKGTKGVNDQSYGNTLEILHANKHQIKDFDKVHEAVKSGLDAMDSAHSKFLGETVKPASAKHHKWAHEYHTGRAKALSARGNNHLAGIHDDRGSYHKSRM